MELFFIDKNNLVEAVSSAKQGKRTLLISASNVEAVKEIMLAKDSLENLDMRKAVALNALSERVKDLESIPLFLDDILNSTLSHLKEMCEKNEIQKIYFID